MPTYEYACTECAHRLEVVQSFTDASLTECPECTGRLRKVFSPVGVVFKGSGFYKTDSRAKSGTSTGSSGTSETSAKSDTKADSPKADSSASTSSSDAAPSGASTSAPKAATTPASAATG